jgi:peptide methionine sulfoxide reductase MsrA
MINAGCFWGTLQEFQKADIKKTYSLQIDYLKNLEKSLKNGE